MRKPRKNDTPTEKLAIFRRHLIDKVPVYDLSDASPSYSIAWGVPTMSEAWCSCRNSRFFPLTMPRSMTQTRLAQPDFASIGPSGRLARESPRLAMELPAHAPSEYVLVMSSKSKS